jgi:hypothetical protein
MPESLPLQKFHRNEGSPFSLVNLVDRADTGMIQRRCSSRFLPDSAESLSVVWNIIRQEFERDKAAEIQILSLVHNPHTAAAELLDNPIVRNRRPFVRKWLGSWAEITSAESNPRTDLDDTAPPSKLKRQIDSHSLMRRRKIAGRIVGNEAVWQVSVGLLFLLFV